MLSIKRRGRRVAVVAAVMCVALVAGSVGSSAAEPLPTSAPVASSAVTGTPSSAAGHGRTNPVLLFAADGMRQDIVERYAKERRCPGFAELLRNGASATGGGMLTQAPPNTGAGWYTHGHRRVAGGDTARPTTRSTSTTSRSRHRTAAFDPGVLQAETIAQSAERGGKKVHPAGMGGRAQRRDQRARRSTSGSFFSGRGVATNYVSPADRADVHRSLRPAVRPPGWLRRTRRSRRRTGRHRLDERPASFSPRAGDAACGCCDFGTDKYGLNAYLYDSDQRRPDQLRPGAVRAQQGRRRQRWPTCGRANWPTSRSPSAAAPSAGKTAGMLVKVEALSRDLSQVRLFHTSVDPGERDLAELAGRTRVHRDFEEYVAAEVPEFDGRRLRRARGRDRQRGDLRRAGPVLGEAAPAAARATCSKTYQPDLALVGYPATDEFQHQFLGLVSPTLPNGAANPAYDDVEVNGTPDGRVQAAGGFIAGRTRAPTPPCALAQRTAAAHDLTTFVGVRPRVRPAVPGGRRQQGAGRSRPAVQAADVELPPGRPVRPSARPRPAGPAAPCRST